MPSSDHPLASRLAAAAAGEYPDPDGSVEFFAAPDTVAAALVVFAAHLHVCGVDHDVFAPAVRPGNFSDWTGPRLLGAIERATGARAGTLDALLAATGRGRGVPSLLREVDALDHPRVLRARRYRPSVRVFTTNDDAGVLIVGRGLVGRCEIAYEVEPVARGSGLGRRLVDAALDIAEDGEPVWAQVAPANAPSLRVALGAGFLAVGAEILFARHPDDDVSA
jgi:GNAT superfamily N-acetyltransferase